MISARVFDLLHTVGADLRRDAFPELLPASGAEVLPEETPVGEEIEHREVVLRGHRHPVLPLVHLDAR